MKYKISYCNMLYHENWSRLVAWIILCVFWKILNSLTTNISGITWNIMKKHSICAEIGLKIEDTMNNITSTTVWSTIMNILYIIYGVFILSQVEKSLSTITRRTLKQNWYIYRLARDGPNVITDPFVFGKLQLIACQNFLILENLKLCVWWWCLFESTSVCVVLNSTTETSLWQKGTDLHTNLVSHVTIIQSSLTTKGGLARKDQMIKNCNNSDVMGSIEEILTSFKIWIGLCINISLYLFSLWVPLAVLI